MKNYKLVLTLEIPEKAFEGNVEFPMDVMENVCGMLRRYGIKVSGGMRLMDQQEEESPRKPGFFWVKPHPIHEEDWWTTGYWDGNNWWIHGVNEPANESIHKIGIRINPPEK